MINMTNKNKIITASVAVVILIASLIIISIWQPFNSSSVDIVDKNQPDLLVDEKEVADKIKAQEEKAVADKKIADDKAMYQKMRLEYVAAGNNDGVIYVDAQLYKLDHPSSMPAAATTSQTVINTGKASN